MGRPALLGALLLSGCASPGAPKAPSLHLPQPVRDLRADRVGSHVDLHWTVPDQSTDREPLTHRHGVPMKLFAEVCREEPPGGPCTPLPRIGATPGQELQLSDDLPPELVAGVLRPLLYQVKTVNEDGRSSDPGRTALTAAGEAPPAVTQLSPQTAARGEQLHWTQLPARTGERTLLRAVPTDAPSGGAAGAAKPRLLAVEGDPGGTIDTAPAVGERVRYTVYRSVTVSLSGRAVVVNGEPASVDAVRTRDVFPPAPPAGLAAIAVQIESAPPEIDLSWEPNTEPDLAGYFVERSVVAADAAGSKPERLSRAPQREISYRDLAVAPGLRYRYTVIAVDTSGNESKSSEAATEALR